MVLCNILQYNYIIDKFSEEYTELMKILMWQSLKSELLYGETRSVGQYITTDLEERYLKLFNDIKLLDEYNNIMEGL